MITEGMPAAVINLFEVVDICEQERDRSTRLPASCNPLNKLLLEDTVVFELGEAIMLSEIVHLFIKLRELQLDRDLLRDDLKWLPVGGIKNSALT